MAYRDDISALGADHLWRFDGDVNDSIGAANGTNTGFALTSGAVCEDATNGSQCNATSDRVTIPNQATINDALTNKAVGGWVRYNSIQLPPVSIYGEGSTGQQFRFVCWAGNKLMLDIVDGSTVYQAFSDRTLAPGRDFHVFGVIRGGNEFALYLDGVRQSITAPVSGAFAGATFDSGNPIELGDPNGSSEVGNATVAVLGSNACNYNFWAHFSNANVPTDAEIREELFEKGARADATVTNQTQLDALADSVRPDVPLAIRVDVAGSLTLTADNITFDPGASVHVQYTGSGTLTWVNNNGSNASIGSTTGGGTINFVTPAVLTINDVVSGSEVRFYDAGTTTELAGTENSGTSFSSSVQASSVDVRIISLGFQIKAIKGIDMSGGDVTAVAGQVADRQYKNP